MSSPYAMRDLTALAETIARLKSRIAALEAGVRANQLSLVSIDDGYISIYDDTGVERNRIGKQEDGTYLGGSSVANEVPPIPPATPIVESGLASLKVVARGSIAADGDFPRDFSHLNVWMSGPGIETGKIVGRINNALGMFVIAPLDYVVWKVWLTAVNLAGTESMSSEEVAGLPRKVVGDDILTGEIKGTHLAAGTITADRIQANSITTAMLAAGSVTSSAFAAGIIIADATLQSGLDGEQMVQISGSGNDIRFYPAGTTARYARIFSYPLSSPYASGDIGLELRSVSSVTLPEIARMYLYPDTGRLMVANASNPSQAVGGSIEVTRDAASLRAYNNSGTLVAGHYIRSDGYIETTGKFPSLSSAAPSDAIWTCRVSMGSAAAMAITWGATMLYMQPIYTISSSTYAGGTGPGDSGVRWTCTRYDPTSVAFSRIIDENPDAMINVWAFRTTPPPHHTAPST